MTQHQNQPHRPLLRTGWPVVIQVLLLWWSASAQATMCDLPISDPTAKSKLEKYDAVFLARVVKNIEIQNQGNDEKDPEADLGFGSFDQLDKIIGNVVKVEKFWQGGGLAKTFTWRAYDDIELYYAKYSPGTKMLIYANRTGSDYESKISMCEFGPMETGFIAELEMIFLDLWADAIGNDKAIDRMLKLVKNSPSINPGPQETSINQERRDGVSLRKTFLHLLRGLKGKGRGRKVFSDVNNIIDLLTDRDARVTLALWEAFKELKGDLYSWDGGNNNAHLVISLADALSSRKNLEVLKDRIPDENIAGVLSRAKNEAWKSVCRSNYEC